MIPNHPPGPFKTVLIYQLIAKKVETINKQFIAYFEVSLGDFLDFVGISDTYRNDTADLTRLGAVTQVQELVLRRRITGAFTLLVLFVYPDHSLG